MSERGLKLSLIILLIGSILGGIFFGYILAEVDKGEELIKLSTYQPTTPTRLYDINGIPFAELYRHKQELLKFRDIPPHVVNAFISVEDNNFYNHFGIDFMAILRAAIVNTIHMKIKQGGSTLTQQLSKAILKDRKKSFTRKFIEALLTLQIEQEYSKEEILEIYFNLIYLGHGSTGLSSASQVYFQKDVKDLTIAEGALLARLPKAPVDYSPFKNPDLARKAHKVVLQLMAENGFIPKEDVNEMHDDFWKQYWPIIITQSPSSSQWGNKLDRAPYFTEHVRKQLLKELDETLIYTGGLRIYTTLDIRKQEIAEEELKRSLVEHDKISFGVDQNYKAGVDQQLVSIYNTLGAIFPINYPDITKFDDSANYRIALEKNLMDPLEILSLTTPVENEANAIYEFRKRTAIFSKNLHVEGAVITIEPETGYIQTMVGGSKFTPKNQFNRAMMARRQTGSSFKPFVYGAAINERAIASGTGLMDAPLTTLGDDGSGWSPEDSTGDFKGLIPASRALALSLNIVSVQVYFRTGPDPIIDFASKLTKVSPGHFPTSPALALGIAELTPYEMALGYSIIQNKGRDVIPFTIRYVIDQSANKIYDKEKQVREELSERAKNGTIQVIPESTAFILRRMLMEVTTYGTPAGALREAGFKGVSGGKTGSTSSYTNVWYCGFDPKLTTVIWMGYDKNSISLGRGMTASVITAPIWGHMYRRFYEGKENPSFGNEKGLDIPPPGVIMGGSCANNGLTPKAGECHVTTSMYLEPIKVGGILKSVPPTRQCDGDRDHFKSIDFRDFLQKEYEISDDEIGKKDKQFKVKTD